MGTDNLKKNIYDDKALRKALQCPPEGLKYPSNFAFITMQKVCQEKLRIERRRRREERIVLAVICAFALGFGGYLLKDMFLSFARLDLEDVCVPSIACGAVCVAFFIVLNGILKKYFTHKQS